jgi:hypothetical protein
MMSIRRVSLKRLQVMCQWFARLQTAGERQLWPIAPDTAWR